MRVCLVNPPWSGHGRVYAFRPPLALLPLGTVLQEAGTEVSIIDLQRHLELGRIPLDASIFERCVHLILDANPDLLGITAYTKSAPVALRLAQTYRRMSGADSAPVVLRGAFFHWVAREVMEAFPEID